MNLHTYKCAEEILEGNFFEIIFRSQIGIPLLVSEKDQWIPFNNWHFANEILKELKKQCSSNPYFYAGLDILARVDEATLVCAILSSPFETHKVRLNYGSDWHDWKQIHHVYHLVKHLKHPDSKLPAFDGSNPMASSFNTTPYQTKLSGYNPETIRKRTWSTYFGDGSFEARPTESMHEHAYFTTQVRKQILYPSMGVLKCTGGISYNIKWNQRRITQVIKEDLLNDGTSYIPYVGTLTIKNGTLRFSASRLLRNRIHNRENKNAKRQGIRDFGGERQPSQSLFLWAHRESNELSRRRVFVRKMKSIGTSNIVYQAFVDSLYYYLCNGKSVTLSEIGTLRVNPSKRISFRTSNKFRQAYKESLADKNEGEDNV